MLAWSYISTARCFIRTAFVSSDRRATSSRVSVCTSSICCKSMFLASSVYLFAIENEPMGAGATTFVYHETTFVYHEYAGEYACFLNLLRVFLDIFFACKTLKSKVTYDAASEAIAPTLMTLSPSRTTTRRSSGTLISMSPPTVVICGPVCAESRLMKI